MNWFSRARLLVLTLICLFWTGLIFVGHFFPTAPFVSVPWRGEQSFEDLLRREGRKTTPPRDFVFLGIDQSTLQLPPLTPEELAGNRPLQLLSERPYPWSREVWALLLDRLFAAGARLVVFDLLFNPPNDGDPAFHAALERYRDKVVVSSNFDFENGAQAITPNNVLIPPPVEVPSPKKLNSFQAPSPPYPTGTQLDGTPGLTAVVHPFAPPLITTSPVLQFV